MNRTTPSSLQRLILGKSLSSIASDVVTRPPRIATPKEREKMIRELAAKKRRKKLKKHNKRKPNWNKK
jgi:hypothetical protein